MPEQIIQCIVEGDSELESAGVLLRRLNPQARVLRPLRIRRNRIIMESVLEDGVELAARKLVQVSGGAERVILVLLDADDDLPCVLGPSLLARVRRVRPDVRSHVVIACREFEAWFLASIESLRGKRGIPVDASPITEPELIGGAKERLGVLMRRPYDSIRDQPAFAALFDPIRARERSPSFAKLIRDLAPLDDGRSSPDESRT